MRANNEQLAAVQRRVSRGEYEINSQRVAVAILERVGVMQHPRSGGAKVIVAC